MKRVASDPLDAAFPTITNDKTGKRSFGEGKNEYNARTLQYEKYYKQPINSGENLFNLFGSKYDPTEGKNDPFTPLEDFKKSEANERL